MNIKKVDGKPMVIHIKEKPKLHVKGAHETKIKGRNVLTVQHGSNTAGTVTGNGKIKLKKSSVHVTDKGKTGQVKKAADGMERGGRNTERNAQGRQGKEREVRQSVNRENRIYVQYQKTKAEKEAAVKKKSPVSAAVVPVAAESALDEMEGGSEVYEAYMAAGALAKPATSAADAGRNLYRSQVAKSKEQKIKKKKSGSRIRGKAVKESAVKAARKTAQTAATETAKETGKKAAKETSKAAAKIAAATAGTGAGGVLAGTLAGEAAGIAMDKRDVKNSTRNRMIKLFVAKMRQEENQDNIGKALKDIVSLKCLSMRKWGILSMMGIWAAAFKAA